MHLFKTIVVSAALTATAGLAQADETLEAVKGKGFVQCGVSQGLPGFSNPDDQGNWTGSGCRLLRRVGCSNVLGDADAVKFTPLIRQGAFYSSHVWRNRCAGAQHDVDHEPRF